MATFSSERIRQGLPRIAGGPAWPDVAGAVTAVAVAPTTTAVPVAEAAPGGVVSPVTAVATPVAAVMASTPAPATTPETVAAAASAAAPAASGTTIEVPLRRGLPRISGGEPWPPAGVASVVAVAAAAPDLASPSAAASVPAAEVATQAASEAPSSDALAVAAGAANAATSAPVVAAAVSAAFDTVTEEVTLRQGLPRVAGGVPWPPAGKVTVERAVASQASSAVAEQAISDVAAETPAVEATASLAPAAAVAPTASATVSATPAPSAQVPVAAEVKPAPTVSAPAVPKPKPKREPVMIGSRTLGQWAKLAVLWGGGAIVAAGIIVLAARGVTTLPGVPEFMARYPGEYHLPEFVADGFPAWARWTHFFNLFLIVLIIRSGLLVRQQQKPDAFFTPKKGGKKISIYLWMHTSLDILWLLNGLVFVVLMFATGHWARIVPTSWEVFPNAASAMLQYLTLEWPLEDGWVNYNSLQQIMYFTVVFIAAPLAAITGVRMSEWWPKDAEKLNKLYPAPIARAIHFPVMLFFVLFILIHVFLVFTTGALKNLNHMFAGTPEVSWVGFWWFAAAVLVTAAVTWAARPLVLAPIAGAFGRVSER